jgi:hypothetical protein
MTKFGFLLGRCGGTAMEGVNCAQLKREFAVQFAKWIGGAGITAVTGWEFLLARSGQRRFTRIVKGARAELYSRSGCRVLTQSYLF